MKHFLFRKQVLNWEYLLSIPSLLVRLPVTVANLKVPNHIHTDDDVNHLQVNNCKLHC